MSCLEHLRTLIFLSCLLFEIKSIADPQTTTQRRHDNDKTIKAQAVRFRTGNKSWISASLSSFYFLIIIMSRETTSLVLWCQRQDDEDFFSFMSLFHVSIFFLSSHHHLVLFCAFMSPLDFPFSFPRLHTQDITIYLRQTLKFVRFASCLSLLREKFFYSFLLVSWISDNQEAFCWDHFSLRCFLQDFFSLSLSPSERHSPLFSPATKCVSLTIKEVESDIKEGDITMLLQRKTKVTTRPERLASNEHCSPMFTVESNWSRLAVKVHIIWLMLSYKEWSTTGKGFLVLTSFVSVPLFPCNASYTRLLDSCSHSPRHWLHRSQINHRLPSQSLPEKVIFSESERL